MHLPRPRAFVKVMPPPEDALRTCPLTLVSVALTVPIAFAIELLCLVYTYYKGIKERIGEACATSPTGLIVAIKHITRLSDSVVV